MRSIIVTPLVVLFLLTLPIDVIAQEESPVVPGARIRVSVLTVKRGRIINRGRFIGTYVSLDADTLVLKNKSRIAPFAIPLASVKKLEVSQGRKGSRALKGAGIGFLSGAVFGFLACVTTYEEMGEMETELACALSAGACGLGGSLIGALIGALFKGEKWEKVPLERVH